MIGKRFGKLIVVKRLKIRHNGYYTYECLCDCGGTKNVSSKYLVAGKTKSCGCLSSGSYTHNMSRTPTYMSWKAMHQRCRNPNNKDYHRYGGRGITIDPQWYSFEQFIIDMGERPRNTTLDRIDNSIGYSKDNCRWANAYIQNQNRVYKRTDTNVMTT